MVGVEERPEALGPLPSGCLVGKSSLKLVLVDLLEGTATFSFGVQTIAP